MDLINLALMISATALLGCLMVAAIFVAASSTKGAAKKSTSVPPKLKKKTQNQNQKPLSGNDKVKEVKPTSVATPTIERQKLELAPVREVVKEVVAPQPVQNTRLVKLVLESAPKVKKPRDRGYQEKPVQILPSGRVRFYTRTGRWQKGHLVALREGVAEVSHHIGGPTFIRPATMTA